MPPLTFLQCWFKLGILCLGLLSLGPTWWREVEHKRQKTFKMYGVCTEIQRLLRCQLRHASRLITNASYFPFTMSQSKPTQHSRLLLRLWRLRTSHGTSIVLLYAQLSSSLPIFSPLWIFSCKAPDYTIPIFRFLTGECFYKAQPPLRERKKETKKT